MDLDLEKGEHEEKEPVLCELCNKKAPISCSRCEKVWYCSRDHRKQDWNQHYRECSQYKVSRSPMMGNYLTASRNIPAGQKIIVEEPLVMGPMMISFPTCLTCHNELSEENYVKCPDCLWPMCSARCYCAKQHDIECQVLAKDSKNCVAPSNFNSTPRYDLILLIRCLLLKDSNRNMWKLLMSMESHWKKLRDSEDAYHSTAVRVLSDIYNFPVDLVHRIRGVISCNAIQVRGPSGNQLRAIYPTISLLNHSCIPNIHLSCNVKGKMEARAAVDIPNKESLTICYSGTLLPTWERRVYLHELHHFICNCKRCSDPGELGSYFSSPRCPKCFGEHLCPLPGTDAMPAKWQCDKCKTHCDAADIMQEIDDWLFRMDMSELFGTGSPRRIIAGLAKIEVSFDRSHYLYFRGSQEALLKLKNDTSFQALKLKKEIWTNMINVFDLLEPGLTLRKGMALYEIGNVTLDLAEEGERVGEMSIVQAETYRKEGVDLCKSAVKILSLEPRDSPENNIIFTILEKISNV